jgi:hypothetical protein
MDKIWHSKRPTRQHIDNCVCFCVERPKKWELNKWWCGEIQKIWSINQRMGLLSWWGVGRYCRRRSRVICTTSYGERSDLVAKCVNHILSVVNLTKRVLVFHAGRIHWCSLGGLRIVQFYRLDREVERYVHFATTMYPPLEGVVRTPSHPIGCWYRDWYCDWSD